MRELLEESEAERELLKYINAVFHNCYPSHVWNSIPYERKTEMFYNPRTEFESELVFNVLRIALERIQKITY